MITVKAYNQQLEEPLIHISNDFTIEKNLSGELSISFSTFENLNGINNPGFDLLQSNSIVYVDGYEFFATRFSKVQYSKTFRGLSTFFKHSKTRIGEYSFGDLTAIERLNYLFGNLDYTFSVSPELGNKVVNTVDFGNDNVISLINKFCSLYGCEYEILPNKVIHFSEKIGKNEDFQYRYKYNVSDVVLAEDVSSIYTRVTGIGANNLTVTYESPNALQFGILEAEPIIDERYADADSLLNFIKSSIQDEPLLSIQSSTIEMSSRSIGETIWFIYEPLNIDMQTRITKQVFKLNNYDLYVDSVVFGNSVPQTAEQLTIKQASETKSLSRVSVKQSESYRGVSVTKNDGLVVKAGDVTTTANATKGFEIKKDNVIKFLVDTFGQLLLDGRLRITANNGQTVLLDAFLDDLGGRLDMYDVEGNLNVRMGSEERSGGQKGGILRLFDDGISFPRVELGALANYGGNGAVVVRDSNNKPKAGLQALPGASISGLVYVNDDNGNTVTSLSVNEGRINNELIATQNWVVNYVVNALANYTPPSS